MTAAREERQAAMPMATDPRRDLERLAGALVPLDAWARQHGHQEVADHLAPVLDYLDAALTAR